jgi:hypothetical protein
MYKKGQMNNIHMAMDFFSLLRIEQEIIHWKILEGRIHLSTQKIDLGSISYIQCKRRWLVALKSRKTYVLFSIIVYVYIFV